MWSFETIANVPDFNTKYLNGETLAQIRDTFGVEVEVLGTRDPTTGAYPIVVCGTTVGVKAYLKHLSDTWPSGGNG